MDKGRKTTTTLQPRCSYLHHGITSIWLYPCCSIKPRIYKTLSQATTTTRDFLFNDQYKEQIEYIRSISDEDIQKRLKLQLPVATISGTFAPTCKAENLVVST